MASLRTETPGTHQHILLSFFQEPSTIAKFIGEIFEVNSIEDIKDMDMNVTHDTP